ncbi:MAG TPA: glycosyltransferase 87 family protein [Thermoleophilaceae bacterium]|nr:glycosyltransferase 87 family protein [Thermoleophilaceae bacterium]
MKRAALFALVLLVAGWALTLWVAPWSDERVNDLFVYRAFAAPVLDGGLPYRDVAFEYPPLAAPAIALPGLVSTAAEGFRWAFAVWTLLGAAAVVLLCGALARHTGGDARRAMLAAATMPLLCGAVLRTHFDLFPVALVLAALLLLVRNRPRAAFAVLGVAVMTKAFPIVIAPIAIAWLLARGRRRDAWQGALVCAAVMAAIAGAAVAVSPDGALDAVRFQLDRPVQVESSPALVVLGLDAVGAGHAESVKSFRSDGLLHPASDAVTSLFLTVLVALVTLLCVRVASGGRDAGARELVLASLAACAGFALFGKVFSPQFVTWVLPLGALAFAWRMHALALAVALVAVLTQIEFPAHYFDVVAREPLAVGVVALRNIALAAVIALTLRELRTPRRALVGTPG